MREHSTCALEYVHISGILVYTISQDHSYTLSVSSTGLPSHSAYSRVGTDRFKLPALRTSLCFL